MVERKSDGRAGKNARGTIETARILLKVHKKLASASVISFFVLRVFRTVGLARR